LILNVVTIQETMCTLRFAENLTKVELGQAKAHTSSSGAPGTGK